MTAGVTTDQAALDRLRRFGGGKLLREMIALAVSIGMLTGRDVFSETPMAALREG